MPFSSFLIMREKQGSLVAPAIYIKILSLWKFAANINTKGNFFRNKKKYLYGATLFMLLLKNTKNTHMQKEIFILENI